MADSPLFRAAVVAEPYVEPDYDQIEHEQGLVDEGLYPHPGPDGYRPATVSDDELLRIIERITDNGYEASEANVRHSLEGEEIRKLLRRYGIGSLRKVSETNNLQGVVKLTYQDFRTLVERSMRDSVGNEQETVTHG